MQSVKRFPFGIKRRMIRFMFLIISFAGTCSPHRRGMPSFPDAAMCARSFHDLLRIYPVRSRHGILRVSRCRAEPYLA